MSTPAIWSSRRAALRTRVSGPILLIGNGLRARNLPSVSLPFRQDSNLLYLSGCDLPDAALLLDDAGDTLFLPAADPSDALWHGHTASLKDLAATLGFSMVRPLGELAEALPPAPRVLAVADEEKNRLITALTGISLSFGREHGDPALVAALIELRRRKGPEEIAELRAAAAITREAHLAVLRATRPGVPEAHLAALFEAVLAARGATPGYGTILSQAGEILHNPHHHGVLAPDRLLLVDGGAEVPSGYGADVTRVFPTSGRFTGRQRATYEAVLAAEKAAIATAKVGVRYREVHDAAARVIAEFMVSEGLLTTSAEEAVAAGAHAIFFPHGVGHLLGLDVHDLENFGDLPAYPPGQGRSPQFGTAYLRLDLPLEEGWVVTIEPGFYAVPAILHEPTLRARFAPLVNLDRAETWLGFGGIRIEDDLHITPSGGENLTADIPKELAEIEVLAGTRPIDWL